MRPVALLLLCCSLLAGCETMSERQCLQADWLDRGRRDGQAGEPMSVLDGHRRACAKVGVVPDDGRWHGGWREGLRRYCTPRSGWERGLAGSLYHGVCAGLGEEEFLRWHRAGTEVHKLREERSANARQIARLEEQLKKETKDDERRALRERIRRLDQDQQRLRRTIETLESVAPPG